MPHKVHLYYIVSETRHDNNNFDCLSDYEVKNKKKIIYKDIELSSYNKPNYIHYGKYEEQEISNENGRIQSTMPSAYSVTISVQRR